MAQRAPKQWTLSKRETITSYESWRQNTLSFDNYTRHFVPFPISTFALCSVHRPSVIKRPTVDYCVILKNARCTEHNAEENYAPVEGEALAVAWALDKARHFVLGCNVRPHCRHWPQAAPQSVGRQEDGGHQKPAPLQPEGENTTFPIQDHSRPGQTPLHRRQLVQVRLWGPNPNKMGLPDDAHAASYSPVPTRLRWNQERRRTNNEEDHSHEAAAQEEHLTLGAMTTLSSIESVTWDNVREQTTSDPTMRQLHDTILMGFPEDSRSMP